MHCYSRALGRNRACWLDRPNLEANNELAFEAQLVDAKTETTLLLLSSRFTSSSPARLHRFGKLPAPGSRQTAFLFRCLGRRRRAASRLAPGSPARLHCFRKFSTASRS